MFLESLYFYCWVAFPILCSAISVFTIVWFRKKSPVKDKDKERYALPKEKEKEKEEKKVSFEEFPVKGRSLASLRILGTRGNGNKNKKNKD